eukprot:TRINITY_DN2819_c0_g2_i2.p2 TRINITY_DN2819_c0_g2~~TRINITY_DN2819_c0_g2_i2.p2  ORF type:complete len:166 (+),score=55.84 TRINITY_DN2819_c0_g2_i2:61-558(+)
MMRTALVMAAAASVIASDYSCPSAPFGLHASCEVTATVNGTCAEALAEAVVRMQGKNGWTDPHNGGNYSVTSQTTTEINGKRLTGKAPHYEDHFTMKFEGSGSICTIVSCSKSQSTSVLDFSTNYCNQHNLYCGTQHGCKYVQYNFHVTEKFGSCHQHDSSACIV